MRGIVPITILIIFIYVTSSQAFDVNCDGREGLTEAIHALQVTAGGTPDTTTSECIPCDGDLSSGGRWCNNGDGTVTDTTTGLIWYNKGNITWGSYVPYEWEPGRYTSNVTAWVSELRDGDPADLTDGSSVFDWRLPTVNEMLTLTSGVDAISPNTQYFFSGIQTGWYWTCSASTNQYPLEMMRVQMPETNGFGVADNPGAFYWGMAVRNPF